MSQNVRNRDTAAEKLYEFADVILDNHSAFGDASLDIDGLDTRVCGTSSFAAVLLLQQTMYEAIQLMVEEGYEPPVYLSANIDGGHERNLQIENTMQNGFFIFKCWQKSYLGNGFRMPREEQTID